MGNNNNKSQGNQQEQQEDQSLLDKIFSNITSFNLCLRPEYQCEQLTAFLQKYQILSLYNDPYYGQCFALQEKDNKQNRQSLVNNKRRGHYIALSKEKWRKNQYLQRKKVLEQISQYSGSQQNVLGFTNIAQIQKQGFLFTNIEIYLAYDYILIDLQKEFQNRIIHKRIFTQSQINIIMKQCCRGLVNLQSANYRSVRMAFIYLCQNGKQIKVAHPKMFNYKSNLQTIYLQPKQKGIYLSPEQINLLQQNQIDQNAGDRANSFSFGMVILSLMAGKYLGEVYDYRTCEILFWKIDEFLKNLRGTYSERLINIVNNLLKQKSQQRLTLRSLLNVLQQKYQLSPNIEITLLKEPESYDHMNHEGYKPLYQEEQAPRQKNYLYGMVHPKVGYKGQYYHQDFQPTAQQNLNILQDEAVIANHRYYYPNNNSQYIGSSMVRTGIDDKPLKQGKGLYILQDGQSYIGDWKDNEMEGHGKLYWDQKKIRYQGYFLKGKFQGHGTQYSREQISQRQNQIDETFIRMHKGSWLKYEGKFKNDKREGPGKAYFRKGKWIGNFKNGQPNGNGIWYGSDGKIVKGIWQDGYIVSQVAQQKKNQKSSLGSQIRH